MLLLSFAAMAQQNCTPGKAKPNSYLGKYISNFIYFRSHAD